MPKPEWEALRQSLANAPDTQHPDNRKQRTEILTNYLFAQRQQVEEIKALYEVTSDIDSFDKAVLDSLNDLTEGCQQLAVQAISEDVAREIDWEEPWYKN